MGLGYDRPGTEQPCFHTPAPPTLPTTPHCHPQCATSALEWRGGLGVGASSSPVAPQSPEAPGPVGDSETNTDMGAGRSCSPYAGARPPGGAVPPERARLAPGDQRTCQSCRPLTPASHARLYSSALLPPAPPPVCPFIHPSDSG